MAQVQKSKRHRSALKAHRQSITRNLRNRQIKKGIRLALRAVGTAAASKDAAKLAESMSKASSALDKAARTGVIHWKAAARKKSRLAHSTAQSAVAAA